LSSINKQQTTIKTTTTTTTTTTNEINKQTKTYNTADFLRHALRQRRGGDATRLGNANAAAVRRPTRFEQLLVCCCVQ
jgi:hypothetical protein